MNDEKTPVRLRLSGSEQERALLSAPAPVPPPFLQHAVLPVVSAAPPRRRPLRLALLVGACLATTTALALTLTSAPPPPSPVPPPVVTPVAAPPVAVPPVTPSPSPSSPARTTRPAAPPLAQNPPPPLHPYGRPGLPTPPSTWRLPAELPPSAAPASHLLIAHDKRRPTTLTITKDGVTGQVRDTPIALRFEGKRLLGKLGEENVALLFRGDDAEGTIAGHGVAFALSHIRSGHLARGAVPAHTTRVELTPSELSWYPGCDEPLRATVPGVYVGSCHGVPTRVTLPAAWETLPVLARLVLLSLVLPEREPGLRDDPPALFGPPDWPGEGEDTSGLAPARSRR